MLPPLPLSLQNSKKKKKKTFIFEASRLPIWARVAGLVSLPVRCEIYGACALGVYLMEEGNSLERSSTILYKREKEKNW